METIWSIEVLVNYFFQGLGEWLLPVMNFFSFSATENFFMLVMPILYWCVNTAIGVRVGIVLLMSSSLIDILKMSFQFPRPYWIFSKVHAYAYDSSFGLPSGHSQKAVAIWGTLAASYKKSWLWIVSIIMVLMVMISRLYLGVHFLSDVLTGFLASIFFLIIYLKFEAPVARWGKKQPLWVILICSLVVTVIPILVVAALHDVNSGWQIPAEWLDKDIDPFNMEAIITLNGSLFGILFGYAWLSRSGGLNTRGTPLQMILRYLLGIAGILAIRYLLKYVFPETTDAVGYILRYIRYGVIGLWLSALAPFVFIKLKLCPK